MNAHGSTQGGNAVARLQRADDGRPLLIPGAREIRVGQPSERSAVAGPAQTAHSGTANLSDSARLEREREAGGAPSERSGPRQRTTLAWLGDWFGRGIEMLRAAPGAPPPGGEGSSH